MAGPLKREVLRAFKNLHRARLTVFQGDERVLNDSREKINKEFRKNKSLTEGASIPDLIAYANAITIELRTTVVQAEEKSPGVYKLKIRRETEKLDNMPFNPDVEIPKRRKLRKGEPSPCCQGSSVCQETTIPSKV